MVTETMVFNLSLKAFSKLGDGFSQSADLDWESHIQSVNVVDDRAIIVVKITALGSYPYMNNTLTEYAERLEKD